MSVRLRTSFSAVKLLLSITFFFFFKSQSCSARLGYVFGGERGELVWMFVGTEASRRSVISRNLRSAEESVSLSSSSLPAAANQNVPSPARTFSQEWKGGGTEESVCMEGNLLKNEVPFTTWSYFAVRVSITATL